MGKMRKWKRLTAQRRHFKCAICNQEVIPTLGVLSCCNETESVEWAKIAHDFNRRETRRYICKTIFGVPDFRYEKEDVLNFEDCDATTEDVDFYD